MSLGSSFWSAFQGTGVSPAHTFEDRPMAPIQRLVLKGAVDVYIRRSSSPALCVSGETAEAVKRLKTTFRNGDLIIDQEAMSASASVTTTHTRKRSLLERIFGGGETHSVTSVSRGSTSIVSINGVTVTTVVGGSASLGRVVVGVELPELAEVCILGSGNVVLKDLQQPNLKIDVSGSGGVEVEGAVNDLAVQISGSGNVNTERLVAHRAQISVTGSGDVRAFADSAAAVRITGSGGVAISGEPEQRSEQVVGSGRVRFRR